MSCLICGRSSFWSSIVKGRRTGLTSPLYPCGCQLLGERRAPPWKRAGEARRTLMSTSPASHQYSTVALPTISQHLPLLSRAGLSKPTHTQTHAHIHTDSARHHTIRQLSSPSSSPARVLQALVPRKAWEMRQAGSGARSGYGRRTVTVTGPAGTREAVAIPASTRCFDFQVWAVGRRS